MAQNLFFEVVEGRNRTKQIPVEYGSFGSSPNAMTVLDEAGIQKFHCIICCDYNGMAIIDEWKAGVKVNGTSIQKTILKSGDEIEVGDCKLLVRAKTRVVQSVQMPQFTSIQAPAPVPVASTERRADGEFYWFKYGGVRMGPVVVVTLKRLLATRLLTVSDVVCADGAATWHPLPQAFTRRASNEEFIPRMPALRMPLRTGERAYKARDSQPPPAIAAARPAMPTWKKVVIGAVLVTVLWPVVGITVLYGYLKLKGKTHLKANSDEDSQNLPAPDSDDTTFLDYLTEHGTALSEDDRANIVVWLTEKQLLQKRMKDYPKWAEQLRFDLSVGH
jgi:hypothetical protein